jgi:hypothetical protein
MDTAASLPDTFAEVNFGSFRQAGSTFHADVALPYLKLHTTPLCPPSLEQYRRKICLTVITVINREIFTPAGN